MKIAGPGDWKTMPLPEQRARIPTKERDPGQRALQTWGVIGRAMMDEHPD